MRERQISQARADVKTARVQITFASHEVSKVWRARTSANLSPRTSTSAGNGREL